MASIRTDGTIWRKRGKGEAEERITERRRYRCEDGVNVEESNGGERLGVILVYAEQCVLSYGQTAGHY